MRRIDRTLERRLRESLARRAAAVDEADVSAAQALAQVLAGRAAPVLDDELADRRARRARWPVVVACAAAMSLVVGAVLSRRDDPVVRTPIASATSTSLPWTPARCPDRADQVPSDPYSPPCVVWSGLNGGATSRGVTGESIRVAVRLNQFLDGPPNPLAKAAGSRLVAESREVVVRSFEAIADAFNRTYQFYGRRLELVFYEGEGDLVAEMTSGAVGTEDDAARVASELRAFADVSALTGPYADALARQRVVAIGVSNVGSEWMSARRPYVWSPSIDATTALRGAAGYYVANLAQAHAERSTGSLEGRPRRLALVAPDGEAIADSIDAATSVLRDAGVDLVADVRYQLDIDAMSVQAEAIIDDLERAGATTVLCACDPVLLSLLTDRGSIQGFRPEWLNSGLWDTDHDTVGQLMDPGDWDHAIGLSYVAAASASAEGPGEQMYRSTGAGEPSRSIESIYRLIHLLAIGIQLAGPDLTPKTFEAGVFGFPPTAGPDGTWAFGPGDHAANGSARAVRWAPGAQSDWNGLPGAWVATSEWTSPDGW